MNELSIEHSASADDTQLDLQYLDEICLVGHHGVSSVQLHQNIQVQNKGTWLYQIRPKYGNVFVSSTNFVADSILIAFQASYNQ